MCEDSNGELFIKVHKLIVTKDISLSRNTSVSRHTIGDLYERSNYFSWWRRLEA